MAIHEFKGWENAPKGTTHFCIKDCVSPWLKVTKAGYLHYWWAEREKWDSHKGKAEGHRHFVGAIARKAEKPKVEKELAHSHSIAYKQLKKAVELCIENPKDRPEAFRKLHAMWIEGVNGRVIGEGTDINLSMGWAGTKQGHAFWACIHNCTAGACGIKGFVGGDRWHPKLNYEFNLFPEAPLKEEDFVKKPVVQEKPKEQPAKVEDGINWKAAPEGTTHHLKTPHESYWVKVRIDGTYEYMNCKAIVVDFAHHKVDFAQLYLNKPHVFTVTPRIGVQPQQQIKPEVKAEQPKKKVGWW